MKFLLPYYVYANGLCRAEDIKFYEVCELHETFKLKRKLINIDELSVYFPHTSISAEEMFESTPFGPTTAE